MSSFSTAYSQELQFSTLDFAGRVLQPAALSSGSTSLTLSSFCEWSPSQRSLFIPTQFDALRGPTTTWEGSMRFARTFVLALFSLLLAFPVFAQQPSTSITESSPRALALLQQSLAVLTGGQPITDVTLTGTARRIAGSDDESGEATYKAISGASRLDLNLSGGARTEIANSTADPPVGSWSGPDSVSHAMANHNVLTEPAWFFPAFAITRRLSNSFYVATYVGQETRDGQTVQHISVSQTASSPDPPGGPMLAHLTQLDFFLDSSTLLPVAITFNIHADDNALLDIPIEIRFSNYRSVNGAQIPFQAQKFLNNNLLLDLQFTDAQLNTGLPTSLFNVQ